MKISPETLELHIFQNEPHGVGLALDNPALSPLAYARGSVTSD